MEKVGGGLVSGCYFVGQFHKKSREGRQLRAPAGQSLKPSTFGGLRKGTAEASCEQADVWSCGGWTCMIMRKRAIGRIDPWF